MRFARRRPAVLRKRHAGVLPRNRADAGRLPGSQSGRPSAKPFNDAASGLTICPAAKSKRKSSNAIPGKNRFPENSALALAWNRLVAAGWPNPESEIRNSQSADFRDRLRQPRSRGRFRRARNFEIRPRRQSFPRLRRAGPQSGKLSPAAGARISPLRHPFFLDRREAVAHHPLAELTRNALRTVAFDWRHDDWFAALKAGFSPVRRNGN